MIQVENLSFSYGNKEILNNLSLTIKKGEITTILGKNGCGKSTLLNLLSKHLTYKKGSIQMDGKEIKDISFRQFSKIAALVSQHNTAPDSITVKELVEYGRIPHQHTKEAKNDSLYVNQALEECNLMELAHTPVSALSGGQMQRVWIAMAMAQNTEVLFLDEPTTYLDLKHQVELLRLIKRWKETRGLTVVMILHDINQALHFSNQIIALKGGSLYFAGKPEKFLEQKHIREVYGMDLTILEQESKRFVIGI